MRNIENKKDILSDEKNVLRKAVSQKKSCVNGETAGVFNAVSESAMHDNMLYRFRARQGHGYAAEQGNDLIDKINLRDARILGNDNKKWGPDRLVDGKRIQTKYCENARASVDAAFEKGSGLYKYTLENGKPMQLEVPNEQYEEAVRIMEKRIAEGKVPHTKNPKDAKKLVRKGNVTYNQAKAIAKAGTVESLVFDAAHGAVIGMSAAGISATITFAKALWDGQDTEIAVEVAMYEGIKMGGMAFASSVLAAQLTRTPFNQMLMGPTIELVKLETRIDKLEQNVNLLTWQNSIEYQDLNGVEYAELDTAGKMVCLTKDFYDITKGVWETKDLLLLKTAMSTVDLQPKEQVNYMSVLKTISDRADLKEKLLQGKQLKQIEDPGYLISMGTLGKLDSLKNEESYIVDTVENYLKDNQVPADKEEIGVNLTYKYMAEKAQVNPNIDVNCYDMMLDLLYNLREAEENQLLVLPESEKLKEAEQLYIDGNTKEAFPLFKELAEEGNGRACYFLGEYYKWGYGEVKINKEKAEHYIRKGDALGDALARVNLGYLLPKDSDERIIIFREMFPVILDLAKQGDPVVENELVDLYDGSHGVEKDNEEVFYWALKSAEQGYWRSQYKIGRIYNGGYGVEKDDVKKVEWYRKSAEKGYDWGMYNVACCYINGEGTDKNVDEAKKWYNKAIEKNGEAVKDARKKLDEL